MPISQANVKSFDESQRAMQASKSILSPEEVVRGLRFFENALNIRFKKASHRERMERKSYPDLHALKRDLLSYKVFGDLLGASF